MFASPECTVAIRASLAPDARRDKARTGARGSNRRILPVVDGLRMGLGTQRIGELLVDMEGDPQQVDAHVRQVVDKARHVAD